MLQKISTLFTRTIFHCWLFGYNVVDFWKMWKKKLNLNLDYFSSHTAQKNPRLLPLCSRKNSYIFFAWFVGGKKSWSEFSRIFNFRARPQINWLLASFKSHWDRSRSFRENFQFSHCDEREMNVKFRFNGEFFHFVFMTFPLFRGSVDRGKVKFQTFDCVGRVEIRSLPLAN